MATYGRSFSWRSDRGTMTIAVVGCDTLEQADQLVREAAIEGGYVAPRWWQIGRRLTEQPLPGKDGSAGQP
jgi:hypothetical protein